MSRPKNNRSTPPQAPQHATNDRQRFYVPAGLLLILLATFLTYAPALNGGLLWDDDANLTRPELQSGDGLYRIWFEPSATAQYYPLVHSAFWLEHKLWGDAVLGYHLITLLWHSLAVLLVYAILSRLEIPGALLAAAIFALHPVVVESAAWIAEQKNTLSAVFYLSAGLAYLRFDQSRRLISYFCALGLFVLALFSKTATVTLPPALLVVFWWQRGTLSWRRDVRPLLPFFVAAALAGLTTTWVETVYIGAQGADFELTLVERFLLAGRAVWFYFGKLFWPENLIFNYPRWSIDPGQWWQWLFPLGVLVVTGALWQLRRRTRSPLAAWLYFCGTLLPVLGFINVYYFRYSYVADHFQYLASLGMIALVAAGIARALARLSNREHNVGVGLCALLLCTLAVLSFRECRMYADAVALYEATLDRNPDAWMIHMNLGSVLRLSGDNQNAIEHFRSAVRTRPKYAEAHSNLGAALAGVGQFQEAFDHLREALRLRPKFFEAYMNFGDALMHAGRAPEAVDQFQAALTLKQDDPLALMGLGTALMHAGRFAEATEHFEQLLRSDPDDANAQQNLGNTLLRAGQFSKAIEHLETAIRLNPSYVEAHDNLGVALVQTGRIPEAIEHFREAVRLNPNFANAQINLGSVLSSAGNVKEAIDHLEQAVRIAPNRADIHNRLGDLLLRDQRPNDAVEKYQAAARLQPDFVQAYANLAQTLAMMNRSEEAIAAAEKGIKVARTAGQEPAAEKVEEWLKHYRIELRRATDSGPAKN